MNLVNKIAFILVIIGGLNWGLFIFGKDVAALLSLPDTLAKIVYALVALSALVLLFAKAGDCKNKEEVVDEPMTQEPMDGPSM